MRTVESFVTDLSVQEFAGTKEGFALLEDDPTLRSAVEAFATTEHHSSMYGHELIGTGNLGLVVGIGDAAVKVSTPGTDFREGVPDAKRTADDLVRQFTFMTALSMHLKETPEAGIAAPQQFFALRTRGGNSMLVQERVRGVEALEDWEEREGVVSMHEKDVVYEAIHRRITHAVNNESPLSVGLADLVAHRPLRLHTGNILVPTGSSEPQHEQLHIIDQPGPAKGAMVAKIAGLYLKRLTNGKTRPIIRRYKP